MIKYQRELRKLIEPNIGVDIPQRVLSERMDRYLGELFVFVSEPDVPPDNNAAERSIRPAVTIRKISGGTRSGKGSRTKEILMSLFGTWKLQGLNGLEACHQMLTGKPSINFA